MDHDATWYGSRPRPGDIELDGDPALPKKGAQQPPATFRPIYCGQMAGWIKMPFGTEVGFRPGHIVLDGDPPERGTAPPPPIFRPMLLFLRAGVQPTLDPYAEVFL